MRSPVDDIKYVVTGTYERRFLVNACLIKLLHGCIFLQSKFVALIKVAALLTNMFFMFIYIVAC